MTPSFGHPTNSPARKYWCSEVADVIFNIFIVQKTTRNLQKIQQYHHPPKLSDDKPLLGRVLGLAADASGSVGQEAPARKEAQLAPSSLCATESISVEVGNAKDLWKISFVFFWIMLFLWGGWWGGNLLSNVKQIVFGTRRPGTSTISRPVKAPGPCNIRSPILPTGHTSQGVTWLQGNHSPSMVGQKGCIL